MKRGPGEASAVRRRPPRRTAPIRPPGPPRIIEFFVPGDPVPYDVRFWNGHVVVPARVKEWKEDVSCAARAFIASWFTMRGSAPIEGPVSVAYSFRLKRPKKPKHHRPIVRPDLLSLIRPTEDALTGIVWHDDAQVVDYSGSGKRYVNEGETPGVHITVMEVVP